MRENRGKLVTANAARKKTIKKIEILIIALLISTSFCTLADLQVKAQTATIWTDKADYQPGEIVTIFGTGFVPNAYITLNASKQSMDNYTSWCLTSDVNGNFTTTYQIDNIGAALYILTATDGTNQATTTFTDSYTLNSISVGPQNPDPVIPGNPVTYTITVVFTGSNQPNPGTLSIISGLPAGTSADFNPTTVPGNSASETSTLTITTTLGTTPPGNYVFTVQVVGGGPAGGTLTSNGSLLISDLSVNVSPASANMDSGQSQTFTAVALGGSGSYTSYKWYVDSALQSETTTPSFTYSPGSSTGTHLITVTVTDSLGTTSALSSPSAVNVNPAPSILTQPQSTAINSGQSTTLTSTVTGGTGSFSWQWYDVNGIVTGISGTGATASYVVSTASTGIYVVFTDTGTGSATPTATATSNPPVTVTVNDILTVSITPANPVAVTVGQSQTFAAVALGGSGSYTSYKWYVD